MNDCELFLSGKSDGYDAAEFGLPNLDGDWCNRDSDYWCRLIWR